MRSSENASWRRISVTLPIQGCSFMNLPGYTLKLDDGAIEMEVTGELESYLLALMCRDPTSTLQTSTNEIHGDEEGLGRFPNSTKSIVYRIQMIRIKVEIVRFFKV